MHAIKRWGWAASLAVVTALGLSACGGNEALPPKASVNKIYVMGDSLADVGTFGFKFTVQDASNPTKGFPIWTQLVANAMGVDGSAQCNVYRGVMTFNGAGDTTSETYTDNPDTSCTNYAMGGGRIVVPPSLINPDANANNPRNIVKQLEKRASLGNYNSNDLVLIDGGGNDAADLAGAFINFATVPDANKPAALATLNAVLSQMGLSSNGADMTAKGAAYMTALSDRFRDQITTHTLNKGATRVAILDIPDITLTPRFGMVLRRIAEVNPAGAEQIKQLIQAWISAYNARLVQNFANDKRVTIVPFNADFTDEVNNPGSYQLTNVTDASCPITGMGSDGLPSYNFLSCTSTALDASPPSGKTAGWWKTYAFSDGFHPTPYGHQLLSASVSRALARAGWL